MEIKRLNKVKAKRNLKAAVCALTVMSSWFASMATAASSGESSTQKSMPSFACLNPPSVSDFVPGDTSITSQNGVNCFAWQVFIGLNWPADTTIPGQPSSSAKDTDFGKPGNGKTQPVSTWETYANSDAVFLPDGAKPKPFGAQSSPWGDGPAPESCASDEKAYRIMSSSRKVSFSKGSDATFNMSGDLAQAFPSDNPNWLADKRGNLVYYEILFSKDQYDFIVDNELYNTNGQVDMIKAHKNIAMPLGVGVKPSDNITLGGLELKAAWLELENPDAGNWKTDYKLTTASIYDETTQTCSDKTLALVGLHIIHKTASQPQWVWATFEHKMNAPDNADLATAKNLKDYNFYSESCTEMNVPSQCTAKTVNNMPVTKTSCDVNVSPAFYLDNTKDCAPYPIQVSRLFKIKDTTDNKVASINAAAQALIAVANADSVFTNYQLVNTLWSSAAVNDNSPPGNPPVTPLSISGITPTLSETPVANTMLETYAQGFNCLSCHASASVAQKAEEELGKSYASDYSFVFSLANSLPSLSCYWMENYGNFSWVSAPQGKLSKQQCYDLNSCGDGGKQSGGGCYKWASGPDQPAQPWK
ncbi:hypothetical protein [Motilimonas pumila]|uniref:Cytochrome c family protein n=1 Tax=Motilimonas pumila TaxID=2303987 RepID=A0A418YC79_9GAMM|nr:hypothetical protein [Motilimonas pumila]RJG42124.1 hypothetical protein D1Z90_14360 [Motilimonas pumila]